MYEPCKMLDRGSGDMDHGPWIMVSGSWTVDRRPWTINVDHGCWTVDHVSWIMDRGGIIDFDPGVPYDGSFNQSKSSPDVNDASSTITLGGFSLNIDTLQQHTWYVSRLLLHSYEVHY